MLLLATVFIILISRSVAQTSAPISNSTHNTSKNQTIRHVEFLLVKCLKNADVAAHTAFMTAKHSLKACMFSKVPANSWEYFEEPTNIKLLCSEGRENAHECIKDVVDKMAVCLPKEEQYLQTFLLNLFDDTAKYMCYDDAAVLKELLKMTNNKENKRYFERIAYAGTFCFLEEFPMDTFELGEEIIKENDFYGYMNKTRICVVKRLNKDVTFPTFLSKLVNTVAELASSSCGTNNI